MCPMLVFGWGPIPSLGVPGAAVSLLVANGAAAVVLAAHLLRRDAAAPLNRSPWRLHAALVRDILRVGVPASMSPVVSNASIAVATAFVGSFGTAALAGYGVAARLEYILVPIAFGFGTALTAMVAKRSLSPARAALCNSRRSRRNARRARRRSTMSGCCSR